MRSGGTSGLPAVRRVATLLGPLLLGPPRHAARGAPVLGIDVGPPDPPARASEQTERNQQRRDRDQGRDHRVRIDSGHGTGRWNRRGVDDLVDALRRSTGGGIGRGGLRSGKFRIIDQPGALQSLHMTVDECGSVGGERPDELVAGTGPHSGDSRKHFAIGCPQPLREHPVIFRARPSGQIRQPTLLGCGGPVWQRYPELARYHLHLLVEVAVIHRGAFGDGADLRVTALLLSSLSARSPGKTGLPDHDQQVPIRSAQRTPPRWRPAGILLGDWAVGGRLTGELAVTGDRRPVLRGAPVLEHGEGQGGDHGKGDGPSDETRYRGAQSRNLSRRG